MRRWIIGFIAVLGIASMGSNCYERPTCSFRCAPDNSCPYEYSCAPDGWCKLKGTSPTYQCSGQFVDAGPPAAEAEAEAEAE